MTTSTNDPITSTYNLSTTHQPSSPFPTINTNEATASLIMSNEQSTKCDELVEQGKKALALSDWEGAVEKYAAALEIM